MATIVLANQKVTYQLIIKPVKNINLRIKPTGELIITANKTVTKKTIIDFLEQKQNWIIKHINQKRITQKTLLGEPVSAPLSKEDYLKIIQQVYPDCIDKYCKILTIAPPPVLQIKSLKSKWGSCFIYKNQIMLNFALIYTPITCIEYVVLHELLHFSNPSHNKDFHNSLSLYMPNWKQYKKVLASYSPLLG